MGTDIHGQVEVNLIPIAEMRGYWNRVITIDHLVDRNYVVFGALFGVRDNRELFVPQFPRRGFPEYFDAPIESVYGGRDTSGIELPDRYAPVTENPDYHSASYFTWEEFSKLDLEQIRNDYGDSLERWLPHEWKWLFNWMRHLSAKWGPNRVRLVVWFDS